MRVYGKCKSCKAENHYWTSANTRVEFAMQDGEYIRLICKNCGTDTKFHVDDLYAKDSKIARITAGLIFLIGTPIVLFFVFPLFSGSRSHYVIYAIGSILLIPGIAYGIIQKQEYLRISSFNHRRL